jgi:hypothetical protein
VLSNPLVVTVIGGLITAAVSVYLSGRFGERAAANYSIKQGRKHDHHLALLAQPADELIAEATDDRRFYQINVDYSTRPPSLNTRGLPELKKGQKREMTETDLLISHLETGYPDLFTKLQELRRRKNHATDGVVKVAQQMAAKMLSAGIVPAQVFDGTKQPDWISPLVVASDFVGISQARWQTNQNYNVQVRLNAVHDEQGDGWSVTWSYQIARTSDERKATEIKTMLETTVKSEYYNRLVTIFEENKELPALGRPIQEALQVLRIKVQAGVPLKGSCAAGQEAEPKFE